VDGFVCDSKMAENMTICGRYGNSCGTPFIKDDFIRKHRQYESFGPYLKDRPSEEWTNLSCHDADKKTSETTTETQQEGGKNKKNKPRFRLTRRSKNKMHKKYTLKSR
jgi:hypothetical protein